MLLNTFLQQSLSWDFFSSLALSSFFINVFSMFTNYSTLAWLDLSCSVIFFAFTNTLPVLAWTLASVFTLQKPNLHWGFFFYYTPAPKESGEYCLTLVCLSFFLFVRLSVTNICRIFLSNYKSQVLKILTLSLFGYTICWDLFITC